MQLFVFSDISKVPLDKGYFMRTKVGKRLLATLMQIGQNLPQIGDPLLDTASYLEGISYHGKVRNKMSWQDQVQK